MSYFYLFFQSNLLEMPVYLPFLVKKGGLKNRGAFLAFTMITGLNAITHPLVFFLIMNMKMTYLFNILTAEFFAIMTEGWILKKITGDHYWSCLLASLFANLLSWQLSPMITYAVH